MFNVQNKTVLITGATGNLGSVISRELARAGAKVLVNSRSLEACNSLVSEINQSGGTAVVAAFDISNNREVLEFSNSVTHLDVIVNNAYEGGGGTVETSSTQEYLSSYEIAVAAAANLVRVLLPQLRIAVKTNGYASIINIASMYGIVSPNKDIYPSVVEVSSPFYGAAKAALIHWTKYAACEFAAENIRVNSISPGPFPGDRVFANNPQFVEKLVAKVPMARIGNPIEVAGPVIFLASPAASFVTGANLVVDGGWTAW